MAALEQVSRRIDKIVDAITTVSIQTNMLAVNGSVEAARAGEFGKGFAVVSTDIRNLARDSAENAERIKDTVKSIQDQIVRVRGDLAAIADSAALEGEKNKVIAANLVDHRQRHERRARRQQGNPRWLGRDRAGREGSSDGRRDKSPTAAQEATRASGEAAGAAREQAKGAEQLAAAIEEIASLADELQAAN